jgi:hypothetical protein
MSVSPIEENQLNLLILVHVKAQAVRFEQIDSPALRSLFAPP